MQRAQEFMELMNQGYMPFPTIGGMNSMYKHILILSLLKNEKLYVVIVMCLISFYPQVRRTQNMYGPALMTGWRILGY